MSDELEQFPFDYKLFLDRTTVFYGASKTGKSVTITNALKCLSEHVDQILVVAANDAQNQDYSGEEGKKGIVERPLIHYSLDEKWLKKVWDRQNVLVSVYKRANRINVLESLYSRLRLETIDQVVRKIKQSREKNISLLKEKYLDPDILEDKIKDAKRNYEELLVLIYKKYINENKHKLNISSLTSDEKYTLSYLNFNPRLVLVLDDVAPDIKRLQKKQIIMDLFYKNRHPMITVIIACQNDDDIPPNLRRNVFTSVFTSQICAYSYFDRKNNAPTPDVARKGRKLAEIVVDDRPPFTKLAFVRGENKFYKLNAKKHSNWTFGAPSIIEYCEQIKAEGIPVNRDNEFCRYFEL